MSLLETMKSLELFKNIPEDDLKDLVNLALRVNYSAGDAIFREGGKATRIFIMVEGNVTIQVKLSSRPENLTIAALKKPGQIVGWSGAIQPSSYTASAICNDDTELLSFDGAAFMAALADNPELGFIIMRRVANVISGRLRNIQRVTLKTM